MKSNSQSNTIFNDENEKNSIKQTESFGLTNQNRDLGHEIWTTK
jgi:hypothetical protein